MFALGLRRLAGTVAASSGPSAATSSTRLTPGGAAPTVLGVSGWIGGWELWPQPLSCSRAGAGSSRATDYGAGETQVPLKALSFDARDESALDVIDALELDGYVIAGESNGGALTMEPALRSRQHSRRSSRSRRRTGGRDGAAHTVTIATADRLRGFLWGAAVGDAIGGAVNGMSADQIRERFGPRMLSDLVEVGGVLGAASQHTQLLLFCCESLIRAFVRGDLKGIGPGLRLSRRSWLCPLAGYPGPRVPALGT